jgi:hypothetical protein
MTDTSWARLRRAAAAIAAAVALMAAVVNAWEYAEHHALGDEAFEAFLKENAADVSRLLSPDALANAFKLPRMGSEMSFGRMVGLWADIYGDPSSPIIQAADPKAEFLSQFDAVVDATGASGVGDTKPTWPFIKAAADFELAGFRAKSYFFSRATTRGRASATLLGRPQSRPRPAVRSPTWPTS